MLSIYDVMFEFFRILKTRSKYRPDLSINLQTVVKS